MASGPRALVKGAVEPHLDALNCRLVRIGPLTVEEARVCLAPLIHRDNAMELLAQEGAYLTRGEALVAIGAAEDPEHVASPTYSSDG